MALKLLEQDVEVVSKLGTNPGIDDGLSEEELKAKFDEGAKIIKEFLNTYLIPELDKLVDVEALLKDILDPSLTKENKAAAASATGEAIKAAMDKAVEALNAVNNIEPGASEEEIAQIQKNAEAIERLPISVNEAGFTEISGLPKLTNVKTVRDAKKTTMTLSLNDGNTSTIVIDYGDNGDPSTITVDGEEVTLEFIYNMLQLFNKGDVCESVTGGWVATSRHTHSTNPYTPDLTIAGDTMTVSYNSTKNYAGGTVETLNEIDLTNFTKLTFNVTAVTNTSGQTSIENNECGISIGVMDMTRESYGFAAVKAPTVGENVIDISAVEGAHKIAINVISSSGLVSVSTDSIKVE